MLSIASLKFIDVKFLIRKSVGRSLLLEVVDGWLLKL